MEPETKLTQTTNTYQKEIRRKKRWKVLAINFIAVGGALALFVLLGFVNKKQNDTICWKLDVEVEKNAEENFISEATIRVQIIALGDSIVGTPVSQVKINKIHVALVRNPSIRKANVFITVDGRCVVKVTQLIPIARILNNDGSSFYIDKEGYTMPLSPLFTAHVPVFTGHISEKMQRGSISQNASSAFIKNSLLDDIYAFTRFIQANAFLQAQVEHVHINAQKKFEVIPRVGNHRIIFGNVDELETKYKKLMAFYAHELPQRNINPYTAINLEYEDQVVCTTQ
ncbi:MAG: hypothetical protein SH856_13515 [Flavobacteriales bacterium]|nr:hypothetical protein [Flavobacteriales bacterium]